MIVLTDYDSSNGDAYQILFGGVDPFQIKDTSNVDITKTLDDNGIIKTKTGFWVDMFGEEYANFAMRRFELPWMDSYVKRNF